eukprot:CAMPEP_0194287718 /NCGR_PEP_ID=MMETSP0169-20130528/35332_1 /TAXON_ID=218684 /ORGANISM="Corethron pennatum, Strain L29A3" /LENGTH=117 /DNA_ID=CAMNT_0039034503 /DNA_START=107 /DNA_END=456 /DNA_ORIENTATION=-
MCEFCPEHNGQGESSGPPSAGFFSDDAVSAAAEKRAARPDVGGAPANDAFAGRKAQILSKGDKSSAGGIDAHAASICATINARPGYYTTSSCSGRSFLYAGAAAKRASVRPEVVGGG